MSAALARSTFVTVLAWVFIGLAGFTSLIALMQNLMLELVFQPSLTHAAAIPPPAHGMPLPFNWIISHFAWFFRGFLLLSLLTLTAAIGLLLRKNWARLLFMALMGVGIVYQLGGLVWQWWIFKPMSEAMALPPGAPANFEQGMHTMLIVMRIFGAVMACALTALFAWIIHSLRKPAIRQEFNHAGA